MGEARQRPAGGSGAVRESSRAGIADVDMRKARRAGIVEDTRVWRALAEPQDAGTVDQHQSGARERGDQLDDLRAVSVVHPRASGEIRDTAAVRDEREAGAVERHRPRACVRDVHLHGCDVEQVATVIVGVVARPAAASPHVGDHRAGMHACRSRFHSAIRMGNTIGRSSSGTRFRSAPS